MMDYKKLMAGFRYREGRITSWDGSISYEGELKELARFCCDNGADEIFVYDDSAEDADHEAAIAAIRETAREVDEPILAGGRVKRLEDVKKYLYAGAEAVFLNAGCQENVDLMKEAADRFGNEKICAFLPDLSYGARAEEFAQLGASLMILKPEGAVPSLKELEEIGSMEKRCLILCGHLGNRAAAGEDGVRENESLSSESAGASPLLDDLKIPFGCPDIEGAVLALEPEELDAFMTMKQQFKGAGIQTDTFESAVDWSEFKLNGDGLIPVIVQDYKTQEVLMLAYMNQEAFSATLATGRMTYFSRSRKTLWVKGETSGHFQYVKSLKLDCDKDTLLAHVKQIGPACHTGNPTCFFTTLAEKEYRETNPLKVFEEEYRVILDRKAHPKEGSYTNYLFDKGIDKILKKLGEEASEIIIASKNPDPEEIKYEIADFLYHMMVLMAEKGITWEEITKEVANR